MDPSVERTARAIAEHLDRIAKGKTLTVVPIRVLRKARSLDPRNWSLYDSVFRSPELRLKFQEKLLEELRLRGWELVSVEKRRDCNLYHFTRAGAQAPVDGEEPPREPQSQPLLPPVSRVHVELKRLLRSRRS